MCCGEFRSSQGCTHPMQVSIPTPGPLAGHGPACIRCTIAANCSPSPSCAEADSTHDLWSQLPTLAHHVHHSLKTDPSLTLDSLNSPSLRFTAHTVESPRPNAPFPIKACRLPRHSLTLSPSKGLGVASGCHSRHQHTGETWRLSAFWGGPSLWVLEFFGFRFSGFGVVVAAQELAWESPDPPPGFRQAHASAQRARSVAQRHPGRDPSHSIPRLRPSGALQGQLASGNACHDAGRQASRKQPLPPLQPPPPIAPHPFPPKPPPPTGTPPPSATGTSPRALSPTRPRS